MASDALAGLKASGVLLRISKGPCSGSVRTSSYVTLGCRAEAVTANGRRDVRGSGEANQR